ncbi:MAG: lysophospholipid acyltransferase family protein [Thermoguttaceae bacterium]|nr:lysophospholipid acyltransferase family protein [Thermoguttaceae bacterium]
MGKMPDWLLQNLGVCGRDLLHRWMGTLDYRIAYYDPDVDPALPDCRRRRLYIFWHEYITFYLYQRHHCRLAMMLSKHRDADVLEKIARLTGFGAVRGSTRRGGAEAILGMIKQQERDWHLTITPDGPRGPRRKMAPGSVYIASQLQIPIIAVGIGYDRPWRLSTWDRFAIPRPGSRARTIPSSEIFVPPNLSRAGISYYTRKVESLLNRLTADAEEWAEKGYSVEGECSMQPGPKNGILYFARQRAAELSPSPGAENLEEFQSQHQ